MAFFSTFHIRRIRFFSCRGSFGGPGTAARITGGRLVDLLKMMALVWMTAENPFRCEDGSSLVNKAGLALISLPFSIQESCSSSHILPSNTL
jgi:hypothetical protein